MLEVNIESLRNSKKKVKKSANCCDNVSKSFKGIDSPKCEYAADLREYGKKIEKIAENLEKMTTWIKTKVEAFEDSEAQNKKLAQSIKSKIEAKFNDITVSTALQNLDKLTEKFNVVMNGEKNNTNLQDTKLNDAQDVLNNAKDSLSQSPVDNLNYGKVTLKDNIETNFDATIQKTTAQNIEDLTGKINIVMNGKEQTINLQDIKLSDALEILKNAKISLSPLFTGNLNYSKVALNYDVEYNMILEILNKKYDMTYLKAVNFTDYMLSVGLGNYESMIDKIIPVYLEVPTRFETDLNFPLFTSTLEGDIYLNTGEFLLNIINSFNGESDIYNSQGDNVTLVDNIAFNKYIESKNIGLVQKIKLTENQVFSSDNLELYDTAELKSRIDSAIGLGTIPRIELKPNEIFMRGVSDSVINVTLDIPTTLAILGADDNGYIVTACGESYYIKYEDMLKDKTSFNLYYGG